MKRIWLWLIRHPWSVAPITALGGFLVFAAVTWDSTKVPGGNRDFGGWGTLALFAGIIALVLASLIFFEWDNRKRYAKGDRIVHIKKLTDSLEIGLKAANALKAQIEESDRLLNDIERRTTEGEALAGLSEQQAIAVKSAIRGELHRYGRRSVWREVAIGLFILVVGLLLGQWFL